MFRSQNFGQTWEAFNNGLSTRHITRLVTNDSAAFAFMPHTGMFYRIQNEQLIPFLLPNARTPAFLGATESHLWASNDSILWRSRNGRDWINTGTLPNNAKTISAITSQYQEREIYIFAETSLFRSSNIGQTWERVDSATLWGTRLLAVTGDTIWLGQPYFVQFSLNKGKTWSKYLRLGEYPAISLEQLLNHEGTIFASGLYNDSGLLAPPSKPWTIQVFHLDFERLASIPISKLAESAAFLMASRKRELLRVYETTQVPIEYLPTNGTWHQFPAFPIKTAVTTAFTANNKSVFVGTNSGLFVLDAVPTSVRATTSSSENSTHAAYPIPASDDVTIECTLPAETRLRLTIHDALGQVVASIHDGHIASGKSVFRWNTHQTSQGVYWYRFSSGSTTQTGKIVLLR